MERTCDFCATLRAVVFCDADAAHLCLPCDSKVHSANALSKRHPRILICEMCRNHSAYARCADHRMFMCQSCDSVHHDRTTKHKKQVIFTYTGCPSAKELAEEWGIDLTAPESSTLFVSSLNSNVPGNSVNVLRQFNSQIGGSSAVSSKESMRSSVSEEHAVGSGNNHIKANMRDHVDNSSVLRQHVPDLRKLQLTESSNRSSKSGQEQVGASSTIDNAYWKMDGNGHQHVRNPDFQLDANLDENMTSKPYPSLFSKMNELADILNGDSLWQSKDSVQSNQLWSQNMQDLGVCDELRSMDDLNMPDFDLTFQNYEELFKGDEESNSTMIKDKTNTSFDPSVNFANSQEQYCNSTKTEGPQFDSGETIFTRHSDKKGSRPEKQAGYTSYRKVKSDTMKRVKSKVWKAEGSNSPDANDVMTRNY